MFAEKLASFITGYQVIMDRDLNATMPESFPKMVVSFTDGPKFVRIVGTDNSERVLCFIEKSTGNVFKAASWKAPAKNFPRGNIYDNKNGLGRAQWTSVS